MPNPWIKDFNVKAGDIKSVRIPNRFVVDFHYDDITNESDEEMDAPFFTLFGTVNEVC